MHLFADLRYLHGRASFRPVFDAEQQSDLAWFAARKGLLLMPLCPPKLIESLQKLLRGRIGLNSHMLPFLYNSLVTKLVSNLLANLIINEKEWNCQEF